MASSLPVNCIKCRDIFTVMKPPLTLPCGHTICKICTCKLELESNRKCPKCKQTWAEDLVDASFASLVKMLSTSTNKDSPVTPAVEEDQQEDAKVNSEEEKLSKNKEPQQVLCADHGDEVLFFCGTCEELLCPECVIFKHKLHDFCLIKKSAQKVKATIKKALDEATTKSTQEVKLVDEQIEKAGQNKDLLQSFEIDVTHEKNIEKNFQKKLNFQKQTIAAKFAELAEANQLLEALQKEVSPSLIEELQRKVKYTPEDLASEEESLILVMARAYMKAKQKTAELSVASFLEQMLAENAEQEEIGRMLVEFVTQKWWDEMFDKATKLEDGGNWYVKDSVDAKAAEFAITSKHPNNITFIRQDEGKVTLKPSMLYSILANATKGTTVGLHFLDSFFEGGEKSQDWREFLSVYLNNDKCLLNWFFGSPDAVSQLPDTVKWLGLPITSAAESRAVTNLKKWGRLYYLNVAVPCSISPYLLSPLPRDVPYLCVHFYKARDGDLDKIRLIIDALVPPDKKLGYLCFPKCQFSFSGCQRLPRLLHGLNIYRIHFSHLDGLSLGEKDAIEGGLKQIIQGDVYWQKDWLFGN